MLGFQILNDATLTSKTAGGLKLVAGRLLFINKKYIKITLVRIELGGPVSAKLWFFDVKSRKIAPSQNLEDFHIEK